MFKGARGSQSSESLNRRSLNFRFRSTPPIFGHRPPIWVRGRRSMGRCWRSKCYYQNCHQTKSRWKMNRSSFSEGPLLKLSWEVSVGGENSFKKEIPLMYQWVCCNTFTSFIVSKAVVLYQLKFEMFLPIMVSKTRKLCLTPPNRSWDCLLKERETFWERVEWLERETTADGGAPTLTKYCKSPAVKPAAEGPQHKIFQIKYRPISL